MCSKNMFKAKQEIPFWDNKGKFIVKCFFNSVLSLNLFQTYWFHRSFNLKKYINLFIFKGLLYFN